MFTGLVEVAGAVLDILDEAAGRRIAVLWPGLDRNGGPDAVRVGDSVAVNGCCLTLVARDRDALVFQAGPETLRRTNLGTVAPGDRVNLERALRVGDRLGGHFVQGHVDATAVLVERRREGDWEFVRFAVDPEWTALMVPKGSVAVDGVSLTLVDVPPDGFSVMLIPHTLNATNLGDRAPGDRVNIETDILAKHVRKLLALAPLPTPDPQGGRP